MNVRQWNTLSITFFISFILFYLLDFVWRGSCDILYLNPTHDGAYIAACVESKIYGALAGLSLVLSIAGYLCARLEPSPLRKEENDLYHQLDSKSKRKFVEYLANKHPDVMDEIKKKN